MDSSRFTFLFHRYLNQTCTDEEKQEFFRFVSYSEYDVQLKSLMKELWSEKNDRELNSHQTDRILQTILNDEAPRKPRSVTNWKLVAAMAGLLITLSAAVYLFTATDQKAPVNYVAEVSTEHQIIKLPDGSVVKLNQGSLLEYPESFTGMEKREVVLTGEGYFDIQHDPSHEFIVRTGKLKTVVLGTAFNIKAYPEDKNITVTVTRGKVSVSDDNNVLGIITPDQQITFDKGNQTIEHKAVDSRSTIAWSDRDLFFDDITFYEAVRQLELRFQVRIRLTDEKLRNCRFTATFVRGEDINQMLTVICEFNGAQFTNDREGNFEITGPGC